MIDIIIALLLYFFSILSIGWFFIDRYIKMPMYIKLALSYGLGIAIITGELFFYFFIFRLSVSPWLYGGIFFQASLALFLGWLYKSKRKKEMVLQKRPLITVEKITISLIIVIFLFSLGNALTKPPLAYDAMTIWSLRAKILLRDGQINFDEHSYIYLGSPHYRSYPWHVSLAEYWVRQLGSNEVGVNILPFGYFLSLGLIVYYGVSRHISRLKALWLVVFFSSMPLIFYHSFNTYADLTLAYYVSVGALFLMLWLKEKRVLFLVFSVGYTGWSLFVKNEGIFYIISLGLALLLAFLMKQAKISKKLLFYLLGSLLLPIMGWLVFRSMHHLPLSDSPLIISWHPKVLLSFVRTLFFDNNWNIWWFIFALGLITRYNIIWRNRQFWPFWTFFVMASGSFIMLYFFTQRAEHALNFTAIARTCISLIPVSIFAFSLLMSEKVKEVT